jgi:hypothetical protein
MPEGITEVSWIFLRVGHISPNDLIMETFAEVISPSLSDQLIQM